MQTNIDYRGYYNHLRIQDRCATGQVRSGQVRWRVLQRGRQKGQQRRQRKKRRTEYWGAVQ